MEQFERILEHGKDGKHKPGGFQHSINDSKRSMNDSKRSIYTTRNTVCQPDDQKNSVLRRLWRGLKKA